MVKKIIAGVAAVVAVVLLLSSMVITKQNEYKLIRQFGKVSKIITEPGISFKIPFIESADTLPKQVQLYDLPESEVITMDKQAMITDSYVLWEIKEPLLFAQTLNSSLVNAESRIDAVVYNAIKNVISSMPQSDVISGRDGELTETLMATIGTTMEQYGIHLLTVETKRLDLPADNKNAVYERMISERDKIAATYRAEGDSEAKIIQNSTDQEVAISISSAQAQAAKIISEGEAEYMRILASSYLDQSRVDFYGFVRALDAAKLSLGGENKTLILSADSPLAQLFYGQ